MSYLPSSATPGSRKEAGLPWAAGTRIQEEQRRGSWGGGAGSQRGQQIGPGLLPGTLLEALL